MKIRACFVNLSLMVLFHPFLLHAGGLSKLEQLGKIMYQDKDFSRNKTQSCQTCHHHISGFADPTNMRDPYYTVVSLGDDGISLGGRNAPSSAYGGFSPPLHRLPDGSYAGGMFWDGRATGKSENLGDPLAEQAQGPPLNPVEMNMASVAAIVDVVRTAPYRPLFLRVFGAASLDDDAAAFDNIARAIASYERSGEVQQFTSRYDGGQLDDQERRGFELVKTHCTACHALSADDLNPSAGKPSAALFTNYGYANIGIPSNPLLQGNPTDLGLGGFLDDPAEYGKFKVPTLRNVAMTAPYGHNGYFPTLRDMVLFKSTRDILNWEVPEVEANLSESVGNLQFTEQEIDDIVAFLVALTDR